MRKLKVLSLVAYGILLTGCWVLSVNPLYTEEDSIFEQGLIGTWADSAGSDDGSWTFRIAGERVYRLVTKEEDEPDGIFEAHLLRLGGHLFLDVYPQEPKSGSEFYRNHVIPAHSFWKVSLEGYVLVLYYLDPEWLRENIDQKKIEIKHVRRGDVIVLTASTAELQEFILQHLDDAFADDPLVLYHKN